MDTNFDLQKICESILSQINCSNSAREEIDMWRERFLNEKMPGGIDLSLKEKEDMAFAWNCFLYVPCSDMKDPEKLLKQILEIKRD